MARLRASRHLGLGRHQTGAVLLGASALLAVVAVVWLGALPAVVELAPALPGRQVGGAILLVVALGLAVGGNMLLRQARPWLGGPQPIPGGGRASWAVRLLLAAGAFALLWAELGDRAGNVLVLGALTATGLLTWYSGHRLLLARLARKPGPLAIYDVVDATGSEDDALVPELTPALRMHLAQVNLYPQAVVPGAAEPTGFVEMVQTASGGSTLFERIARFLLALIPSHAYAVHCTALRREGPTPCGVAVQLQLRPRWMSAPKVHWARTYDEAVFLGACGIAETILPWTREGAKAPWVGWMDDRMPPGLVADYVRSTQLVEERRYDEAAGALRRGLRKDPSNLQLRLDLAHVYQRMTLWMDALELYAYVDDLAARQLEAAPWVAVRRKARAHKAALREQRTLAQYRRTIALAWGDDLARQWMCREPRSGRERDPQRRSEKRRIRRRSVEQLIALFPEHPDQRSREPDPWWAEVRDEVARLLREPPPSSWVRPRIPDPPGSHIPEVCLQLVFQLLATTSVRRHLASSRRDRILRPHTLFITRTSWDLLEAWARYRLLDTYLVVRHLADEAPRTSPVMRDSHHRAYRTLVDVLTVVRHELDLDPAPTRPSSAETLLALREDAARALFATVERLVPDLDAVRGSWLDHYNAACTYLAPFAMPRWPQLRDPWDHRTRSSDERGKRVELAVEHLRAAMRRRRPSDVAGLMAWVCSEDPDLAPARNDPRFATFVARHFPGTVSYRNRPDSVHLFELALYTNLTIHRMAEVMAERWRHRATQPAPDGPELARMWARDAACWQVVRDMARDYKDWRTRLRLVETLEDWLVEEGLPCEPIRYPAFDDYHHLLEGSREDLDAILVRRSSERFAALLRALERTLADITGASQTLAERSVEPGVTVRSRQWRKLAAEQVTAWAHLAAWLDHHALVNEPPEPPFDEQLTAGLAAATRLLEETVAACAADGVAAPGRQPSASRSPSRTGIDALATMPHQLTRTRHSSRRGW